MRTTSTIGLAGVVAMLVAVTPASAATGNIFTVAGTGAAGFSGDGIAATAAAVNDPYGVAATADGGFLIADSSNNRVRRVSPSGQITTVAGTGTPGNLGDGAAATAAELDNPTSIAPTADGGFLIADSFNDRVRRVSANGIISAAAGTGTPGFSGDGAAATAAQLSAPGGVAAAADGGFLIVDRGNERVRRVSPGGTIDTVAGTGAAGSLGDGGPAKAAELNTPTAVAATADGGFLVADADNNRVRRVSALGTITTVAGTGAAGSTGDGGPATAAQLGYPRDVAPTADGGFLIADRNNDRVRRVAPTGTITTVAGSGVTGFAGDGGAATAAQFDTPRAVAVTASGGFLVADSSNNRVRFVDIDLRPVPVVVPVLPGGPVASPPVRKPQCSDGRDNDGDKTVDLADPGCSSATDDDESDESVADLVLCGRSKLKLVRADVKGRKVLLSGVVSKAVGRKKVAISTLAGSRAKKLTTATPKADGTFAVAVKAPSSRQRAKIRYRASVAGANSAALKLAQTLAASSVTNAGNQIAVKGTVQRSRLGKRNNVVIRRILCGRTTVAGSAKPFRNGSFTVRFPEPAGDGFAFYRAESSVLARPKSQRYVKQFARAVAIRLGDTTG